MNTIKEYNMKINILTIITVLFIANLTACAFDRQTVLNKKDEPAMLKTSLYDKKWQFIDFASQDSTPIKATAYIQFNQKGDVSGFSGCNRFFGKAKISHPNIAIGPLGSTRKACSGVMKFEAQVLKMFRETDNYKLEDEKFILYTGKTKLGEFK